MFKVGLSSCGFELTEANFRGLRENGIDVIEIAMDPAKFASVNYREILEYSKRYSVGLWSLHLPFYPFKAIDISSPDKELRDSSIRLHKEIMGKAADIGIDKFIVHPSGEPIADEDREEKIKYSMESLDTLAEIAYGYGARIAVEDLPRTCLGNCTEEVLRLISANDKLRVGFDMNHLLKDGHIQFLEALGDKIITLHVSDYDFIDERHWLPGEGQVDWSTVISKLREVDYGGVWMYEVRLKAPKTIERDRDLVFADFRRNADELFSGAPLTVLGTPKENI